MAEIVLFKTVDPDKDFDKLDIMDSYATSFVYLGWKKIHELFNKDFSLKKQVRANLEVEVSYSLSESVEFDGYLRLTYKFPDVVPVEQPTLFIQLKNLSDLILFKGTDFRLKDLKPEWELETYLIKLKDGRILFPEQLSEVAPLVADVEEIITDVRQFTWKTEV